MTDTAPPRAHRYAAYFAPTAGCMGWETGSQWLGRCAASGQSRTQPIFDGLPPELLHQLTAAPRRYGWHATLTAPFALQPHLDEDQLRDGLRSLCQPQATFPMSALKVALLDDFLALVPTDPSPALNAVASQCVRGLHAFAAPLSPTELQRRRAAGLTPEEDALLLRWGYPFVMERYRFHFSLTGSLRGVHPSVVDCLHAAARQHFAEVLASPGHFDAVSLFAEPAPAADFVLLAHVELGR